MKHHTLEQLRNVGGVGSDFPYQTLSRKERLERWAELLEQIPHRHLSTLHETEHQPADVRATMRDNDTPISIAYKDPILRAAGLENDTYGEAKRFFKLSDRQMHGIVCYCRFGATVHASAAARTIRGTLNRGGGGLIARLRAIFAG